MITFKQGPADGKTLSLQRVPVYLRVVVDESGKIDALDQLDDTPRPGETIHVYKMLNYAGTVHIDRRDPRTGKRVGEWLQMASYQLMEEQPTQDQARDTATWQNWVAEQVRKEEATP